MTALHVAPGVSKLFWGQQRSPPHGCHGATSSENIGMKTELGLMILPELAKFVVPALAKSVQ